MNTRRQYHNKAKLAFILPNFDGAKRIGPHNWDILSVLVGSLLGNGCAKREKSGGVRFWFKQSEAHKDYIFWLYEFFNKRGYCSNNLPVLYKGGDKLLPTYYGFVTYRYTNLLWLYKLFYSHSKQKRVPKNIADLLTPFSLVIWISDCGVYHNSGIILNTSCFTKKEVILLSLALETKFNIKSYCFSKHSLHKNSDNFLLKIKIESIPLLKKLLEPYIISSVRFRLGL